MNEHDTEAMRVDDPIRAYEGGVGDSYIPALEAPPPGGSVTCIRHEGGGSLCDPAAAGWMFRDLNHAREQADPCDGGAFVCPICRSRAVQQAVDAAGRCSLDASSGVSAGDTARFLLDPLGQELIRLWSGLTPEQRASVLSHAEVPR